MENGITGAGALVAGNATRNRAPPRSPFYKFGFSNSSWRKDPILYSQSEDSFVPFKDKLS
jgi:hypothetical protein